MDLTVMPVGSAPTAASAPIRVGMISLGCAKNLVDAEVMLGDIRSRGMEVTADATEADVLIVNTCAFIDSAKEESIEAILDAHQQRGLFKGRQQKLIVSGCMSQRFARELAAELPEVDAFMGLDQVGQAGQIVEAVLQRDSLQPGSPLNLVTPKSRYIPDYDTPRFRLTPAHYAFVKIAEGCNHPCSFCVIPQMRGRHRSRTIESIAAEVHRLSAEGVREFNLISQDTTFFGMDLWAEKAGPRQPVDSRRGPTLSRLIERLDDLPDEFWVRLLYTHPAHWSEELITVIARSRHVVPYVDMPLQHIDGMMLEVMRRETSREHIEELISRLRAGIPGLTLRTTFIVGFPGETEAQFTALLEFIARVRFERLGIFLYSREEGSRAAKMPDQVPVNVKKERYRRAMSLQQQIAREVAREQVGRHMQVLVDQPLVARSKGDAPEVDAKVILDRPARVGEFLEVEVTGAQTYDLRARASAGAPARCLPV